MSPSRALQAGPSAKSKRSSGRGSAVGEALGLRAEYLPTYSETDKYAYQLGVYTGILVNMPVGVFMVPLLLALMVALALTYLGRSPFVSLALRDFLPTWPYLPNGAAPAPAPMLCGPDDYVNDEIAFGRRGVLCPPFWAL